MSKFDESKHPRGGAGRFATKPHSEPEIGINAPTGNVNEILDHVASVATTPPCEIHSTGVGSTRRTTFSANGKVITLGQDFDLKTGEPFDDIIYSVYSTEKYPTPDYTDVESPDSGAVQKLISSVLGVKFLQDSA